MPSSLKWLAIAVAVAALLLLAVRTYFEWVGNPRVTEELRRDPMGERASIVMLLRFADGRQIPVNYLREGDEVYVGADGPWWRRFRDGGESVTLEIRGETLSGHAVVVLDDPDRVRDVFSRLRPTVPSWLPAWLNGKLVVISLAPDAVPEE